MYKYFIKQRRNPSRFGEKTHTVLDCVVLLCMIDFMVNVIEVQALWLSCCMCERGIGGPPFLSLHTFQLPINDLNYCHDLDCHQWYVSVPVGFDFIIVEWVKSFWVSFINFFISLDICCRNDSDYFTLLCIVYPTMEF